MDHRDDDERDGIGTRLFVALQQILPTHALSLLAHHLAQVRARPIKNVLIRLFARAYAVDLSEAESPRADDYAHFNAFFTRALKPGARIVADEPGILVSPCDGTVSQLGTISDGRLIQAKGLWYSAGELLGDAGLAREFDGGGFCTIYLAPYNYHRVHMPEAGRLLRWSYRPGRLFSVNAATAARLPGLFVRNERVCALFDTDHGPLAMVLVGALLVGGIETVFSGPVTPPHGGAPRTVLPEQPVTLARGQEMGRFNMGSTVILLTAPGAPRWLPELAPGSVLRMGRPIAR